MIESRSPNLDEKTYWCVSTDDRGMGYATCGCEPAPNRQVWYNNGFVVVTFKHTKDDWCCKMGFDERKGYKPMTLAEYREATGKSDDEDEVVDGGGDDGTVFRSRQ